MIEPLRDLPVDFIHEPPKGYEYKVRQHKPNVISIWLYHRRDYVYTTDMVNTIWGFYHSKRQKYYAPINSKKPGEEVSINNTRPYTAMQLNLNPLEQCMYQ